MILHMDNIIEEYIHLDVINNHLLFNSDNVKRCISKQQLRKDSTDDGLPTHSKTLDI